ncbi:MAG TPA: hypothetical protein PKA00_03185 [Saprospiraceae bacterium]|nr:hypothetical protein [Saprospiraceae bacterium]HMQ81879.1 hypothetical protein [Saprospiraceae bacterium]
MNRKQSLHALSPLNTIYHLLGLMVLLFIAQKAGITGFTHDESYTYNHFFHLSEKKIILYGRAVDDLPVLTNNHIFNTLMMKLSESLFGFSEFALRLPNILAFAAYYCGVLFLLRDNKAHWKAIGFVLLLANPYLIDFFGLARGYGLSIALLLWSLYHFLKYLKKTAISHLLLFHLCAILSVWSNFATINYYAAAMATAVIYPLLLWEKGLVWPSVWKPRNLFISFGFLLLLALLIAQPFQRIIELELINFGGNAGFWQDTVVSLIQKSAYGYALSPEVVNVLLFLVAFVALVPLVLFFQKALRGDKAFFKTEMDWVCTNLILVLIALSTVTQHYLFGQDYLMERFAVFLYPLFVLNLFFSLRYLGQNKLWKTPFSILAAAIALVMTWHTFSQWNTRFYLDWKYDMDTKKVIALMMDDFAQKGEAGPISVGVSGFLEPTMNFYRHYFQYDAILPMDRSAPLAEDAYLYYLNWEIFNYQLDTATHRIIYDAAEAEAKLLENQ